MQCLEAGHRQAVTVGSFHTPRDMQTLRNIRSPSHLNTGDISTLALLPLLLFPEAGNVTVTDRRGSATIPKQASSGPMSKPRLVQALTPLIFGRGTVRISAQAQVLHGFLQSLHESAAHLV